MDLSGAALLDGQHALPAEAVRLQEILTDYDPYLRLAWVPPENRELDEQYPFAVVDTSFEPVYVVKRLKANELDQRVLADIFLRDNAQASVLDRIEAEETARQLINYKKKLEADEEREELAKWALGARSGAKHNGVTYE